MEGTGKKKTTWKSFTAGAALAVAGVLAVFAGFALAKMLSGTSGDSEAQVAVFAVDVEETGESSYTIDFFDEDSEYPPKSDTVTYPFMVANSVDGKVSDVSIKYDVSVIIKTYDNSYNIEWEQVDVQIDGKITQCIHTTEEDGSVDIYTYTLKNAGIFAAGKKEIQEHRVEFVFKRDSNLFPDGHDIDPQSCFVKVHAEQID